MKKKLSILRLVDEITPSSPEYYQFSLPLASDYEITLCSYFKSELEMPESIQLFEGDGTLPGYFKILQKAFAAQEFDVVHAHSPHVGLFFLLAKIVFAYKMKVIIYTVHNSFQNYKLRNKLLLFPVYLGFSRIACCSLSSKESMPRLLKFVAGKRMHAVQNGMNQESVDAELAELDLPATSDRFVVCTVMRLVALKNVSTLVSAFGQRGTSPAKLLIIGDGAKRSELEAQVEYAGLQDNVEFTGMIPRSEVYLNLSTADLFVSTSRGEGLPIAVLEAMACRCPVILSDIPPHREIAEGCDFISLVAPDDAEGLAREIAKMQALAPEKRIEIGNQCRRVVEEKFDMRRMHREYDAIYRELVDSK